MNLQNYHVPSESPVVYRNKNHHGRTFRARTANEESLVVVTIKISSPYHFFWSSNPRPTGRIFENRCAAKMKNYLLHHRGNRSDRDCSEKKLYRYDRSFFLEQLLKKYTNRCKVTSTPFFLPEPIEPIFHPERFGFSSFVFFYSFFIFRLAPQVSWIRHRDIHILTVGSYTYTSDQRFQATHHKNTDDWTLQIKWAQKRDAGIYECQISTQPVRSYFVTLSVVGKYIVHSMFRSS